MTPFLITDCGSTVTKALLIGGEAPAAARLLGAGEAPTTVEAPHADVTVGVLGAIAALEDAAGLRLRTPDGTRPDPRAARYLSTSSAGGGLQMLVAGVVPALSAGSAERAALAAGAIVQAAFSVADGLRPHERIAALRRLRPDIVLLAGGTDGGTIAHVAELAEVLAAAAPEPRLGRDAPLPVVYAGNAAAWPAVAAALRAGGKCLPRRVANVRPTLDQEDLAPARDAIHELFMEHVMARAPGYDRLVSWVSAPVLPTPSAAGITVAAAAARLGAGVLAVDIGGATTDVFSAAPGQGFRRSVSANLGMSYSAAAVLARAGAAAIARWLPEALAEAALADRIGNKMIRPTTVPATPGDLLLEQALAREALRLAWRHHAALGPGPPAAGLAARLFGRPPAAAGAPPALLIGSGGVLSHAPRPGQAALMLLDGLTPGGIVALALDRVFMLPHLGVLRTVAPEAADAVLWGPCLLPLCTAVVPAWRAPRLSARLRLPGGVLRLQVPAGTLRVIPLPAGATAAAELAPSAGADLGAGPGRGVTARLAGGELGLLFDCRGRPLPGPAAPAQAREWLAAAGALP